MTTPIEDARRRASRVAARAEILDVRLTRSRFELVAFPMNNLAYTLEVGESALDWEGGDDDTFVVSIPYNILLQQATDSDGGETPDVDGEVARMEFEFAALFSFRPREDDDPFAEDELLAYANTTASFAIYPFVREYVYDVTGRLRLPALTLGVLLQPTSGPSGATREESAPS